MFSSKHKDIGDSLVGDTKQNNNTPLEVTIHIHVLTKKAFKKETIIIGPVNSQSHNHGL